MLFFPFFGEGEGLRKGENDAGGFASLETIFKKSRVRKEEVEKLKKTILKNFLR